MRARNKFVRNSRGREVRRAKYSAYIVSSEWYRRRERWEEAETRRLGRAPRCAGCSKPWSSRSGDMHHITYDRLGREAHDDLMPLCRGCHTLIHKVMESSSSWRRLPRRLANRQAIERVRAIQLG